jgi:hypothetical protein
MAYIDVFNGDADGICALHQLRLVEPLEATLVTGLKRDIQLLKTVKAASGDMVTVLDISLDRNRKGLDELLARGAHVRYFDHHYAGCVPVHRNLEAVIDDSGVACTSGLVDRHLGGRHRLWAIVGAFGDGFEEAALALARAREVDAERLETLRELGAALNYNAYGETEADVMINPAALYRMVSDYADPFELFAREPMVAHLCQERAADLRRALKVKPLRTTRAITAIVLPDEPWSRRVSGTLANRLALDDPQRAHVVVTPRVAGGYVVSLRSPSGRSPSAVDFCRGFPTGGGRRAAAGIDVLEEGRLEKLLQAFETAYAGMADREVPG